MEWEITEDGFSGFVPVLSLQNAIYIFFFSQGIIMFLQSLPTQDWGDHEVEMLLSEAFVLSSVWHNAQSHFSGKWMWGALLTDCVLYLFMTSKLRSTTIAQAPWYWIMQYHISRPKMSLSLSLSRTQSLSPLLLWVPPLVFHLVGVHSKSVRCPQNARRRSALSWRLRAWEQGKSWSSAKEISKSRNE